MTDLQSALAQYKALDTTLGTLLAALAACVAIKHPREDWPGTKLLAALYEASNNLRIDTRNRILETETKIAEQTAPKIVNP